LAPLAARRATTTIPIVFVMGADAVQIGLVASLGRPGGNITGATLAAADLTQKRLQLLHDVVPAAKAIGFLFNPDNAGANSSAGRTVLDLAEAAVRTWNGAIEAVPVRSVADFEAAVAALVDKRVGALATSSDSLFNSGREQLAALAMRHALPTSFI